VRAALTFTLALAAVAGSLAGIAVAQPTSPLSPGLPAPTPSTATTTPQVAFAPTSTSGGSGLSGASAVAIGVAALVVISGIAFFIWYDARKRAPVRHRASAGGRGEPGSRAGSKQRIKPRKLSPAERRRRKRGRAR
jgi:hypothetical protein